MAKFAKVCQGWTLSNLWNPFAKFLVYGTFFSALRKFLRLDEYGADYNLVNKMEKWILFCVTINLTQLMVIYRYYINCRLCPSRK